MPTSCEIVTATVSYLKGDRGFGFAETIEQDPRRVFFHASNRCLVGGSHDLPELTRNPSYDGFANLIAEGRSRTTLVLQIEPNAQGWRARSWGVVPQPNWRVDLAVAGVFDRFVGGQVTIRDGLCGSARRGILQAIAVTAESMMLRLDRLGPDIRWDYHPPEQLTCETLRYDLRYSSHQWGYAGSVLIITVRENGHEWYIHLDRPLQ